jgi:hypothetical protein
LQVRILLGSPNNKASKRSLDEQSDVRTAISASRCAHAGYTLSRHVEREFNPERKDTHWEYASSGETNDGLLLSND